MIRMAIQVVLVDEAGDQRDVHEIVRIDRERLCPEALGLSLEEAKAITGGIQQVLAGEQVAEWHADQRACPDCGRRRSLKGRHRIVFRTPFGAMRLDSERLRTVRAPRDQRARRAHWLSCCTNVSVRRCCIWRPNSRRWFPMA